MRTSYRGLLLIAAISMAINSAGAATIVAPATWSRPTTPAEAIADKTTFDVWNESFTTASGQNLPGNGFGAVPQYTPASVNPNSTNETVVNDYLQDVTAATDGAFLIGNAATGTAHLYSFSAIMSPTIFVPQYGLGAGWETDVFVQAIVAGSALDPDSVTLSYEGLETPLSWVDHTESSTPISGGFGGALSTYTFSFVIPGFNPAALSVVLPGVESSVSYYAASIDTHAHVVPEPAALVLAGFGGAAMLVGLYRRRTRNHRVSRLRVSADSPQM